MHLSILSESQHQLLPHIARFRRQYYLVGGTAIALHIGHRQSIDFDLFRKGRLNSKDVFEKITNARLPFTTTLNKPEQINLLWNGVKCIFFQFPYNVPATDALPGIIGMPDLLTLAAMKAFALGRRAKWKDYVDLYFILKYHHDFKAIVERASVFFGPEFLPRLFKAQLGYFDVMDASEEVVYCIPDPPSDEEIRTFLEAESVRLD